MNTWDLIPVVLLMLVGVATVSGAAFVLVARYWRRKQGAAQQQPNEDGSAVGADSAPAHPAFLHRPTSWLAIRGRSQQAVQAALGLDHAKPCTWTEGFAGEQKVFIAPPIKGWILVVGSGLPDPSDDVDACFRFLTDLSRQLGQVQYFSAVRVLGHHAWVRVEAGRVVRAYAWAGTTLWNQGIKTHAELELGVKCFHYLEAPERELGRRDVIASNTEKVPLLAACWSLDPASIDERLFEQARGIAGEPRRLY